MNQAQKDAAAELAAAMAKITEAGPQKLARMVTVGIFTDGVMTNVHAVVFAETDELLDRMVARLAEASRGERFGSGPPELPSVWKPTLVGNDTVSATQTNAGSKPTLTLVSTEPKE